MVISKKDFTKLEYLIGFVNKVIEMVSDPEEDLDFNTKDSSIYSLWYSLKNDQLKLCGVDGDDTIVSFKENLQSVEAMIEDKLSVNHTKEWEELR